MLDDNMTTTARYPMTCPCGHKGAVKLREKGRPFSRGWENYSLENFNGGSASFEGFGTPEEAFAKMKPTCPSCDRTMTLENISEH